MANENNSESGDDLQDPVLANDSAAEVATDPDISLEPATGADESTVSDGCALTHGELLDLINRAGGVEKVARMTRERDEAGENAIDDRKLKAERGFLQILANGILSEKVIEIVRETGVGFSEHGGSLQGRLGRGDNDSYHAVEQVIFRDCDLKNKDVANRMIRPLLIQAGLQVKFIDVQEYDVKVDGVSFFGKLMGKGKKKVKELIVSVGRDFSWDELREKRANIEAKIRAENGEGGK